MDTNTEKMNEKIRAYTTSDQFKDDVMKLIKGEIKSDPDLAEKIAKLIDEKGIVISRDVLNAFGNDYSVIDISMAIGGLEKEGKSRRIYALEYPKKKVIRFAKSMNDFPDEDMDDATEVSILYFCMRPDYDSFFTQKVIERAYEPEKDGKGNESPV
jgi:hypothetical protein